MVRILTVDVGVKNLGICVMEPDALLLWTVQTVLDADRFCTGVLKNSKVCGKRASYSDATVSFCKTHLPKGSKTPLIKKTRVKTIPYQTLTTKILESIELLYENEITRKVDTIVIELQPSINRQMKFMSHVIYTKFVDLFRGTKTNVKFVSASRKLRAYKGPLVETPKKGYARRKYLSVQYCEWFLANHPWGSPWIDHFQSHKKKDDLADILLMAINELSWTKKK